MKYVYWALGIGALIALLAYAVIQNPVEENGAPSSVNQTDSVSSDGLSDSKTTEDTNLKNGIYKDYSKEDIKDVGYNRTIIFFYAPWCPECRGYDRAILDSTIPDGVQILKVDYDSSIDLRKKHGVTIQTSFVSVDKNGEKLKLWIGYGQTKSLDAVLENTK